MKLYGDNMVSNKYPVGTGAYRVLFDKIEDYSPDGSSAFAHDISGMRKDFIKRVAYNEEALETAMEAWKSHQVCIAAEKSLQEDSRRVEVDYTLPKKD